MGLVTLVNIDLQVANIGQCTSRHLLPHRRIFPPKTGTSVNVRKFHENWLVHHQGNQGARVAACLSRGNQPEIEKLATGKTNGNLASKITSLSNAKEVKFPLQKKTSPASRHHGLSF